MKRLLLTIALVAGLLLSGCGSDDKKPLPPLPSSTPTAKPSTGTLLDKVPQSPPERPKDVKSEAGAKAFAIYVPKVLSYTIASGDLEPLVNASAGSCKACLEVVTETKGRDTLQVSDAATKPSDTTIVKENDDAYEMSQTYPFPDSSIINRKTGDLINESRGVVYDMKLTVKWTADSWRVAEYAFTEVK